MMQRLDPSISIARFLIRFTSINLNRIRAASSSSKKKGDKKEKGGGTGKEQPQKVRKPLEKPPYKELSPSETRPLYLDAQASSPIDPRVLDAMMPYFVQRWGNPHSRSHYYGWEAEAAVEKARRQIASLINADPKEVYFTSGATESNNMALKGVMRAYKNDKKNHLITVNTEHKCILESARALQAEGFKVTIMGVQKTGLIDLKELESLITPETALVSVMTIHNEIGVHQNIPAIGELCAAKKVLFHTDAAQGTGKVHIDVKKHNICLMSMSAHKVYGPKGVGALFVRKNPPVKFLPNTHGGGQEGGYRSGTIPAPLAVGMGSACEIAQQEIDHDTERVKFLSQRFRDKVMTGLTHVYRNGSEERNYAGCFNLSFAYVEGESLIMGLKDVALSSGSACTSSSLEASYVLKALGMPDELAHSSIRFGVGRFTTVEEIDYTAEKCITQVKKLREMSPLWEMVQEGVDLKTIIWAQH